MKASQFFNKYINYILFGICLILVGLIYSIFIITSDSSKDKTILEILASLNPTVVTQAVTKALTKSKLNLDSLRVGNVELNGDTIKFYGDYGQITDQDNKVSLKFQTQDGMGGGTPRIEAWKDIYVGWGAKEIGMDGFNINGPNGTIDIKNPKGHFDIKDVGGVWGSTGDRKGITLRSRDKVGAEKDSIDFNVDGSK